MRKVSGIGQDAYAPSDVHLLVAPEYAYLSAIRNTLFPLHQFEDVGRRDAHFQDHL